MAQLKFHKIEGSLLPNPLEPNAFYYMQREVTVGGQTQVVAEGYLTNQAGEARSLGNVALIGNIASELIAQYMANMQAIRLATDIANRDAIAAEDPQINKLILVADATGDSTVTAGSALYFYDVSEGAFTKVAEYESMDIEFTWASIKDGPTSTPAQLDDTVAKAHSHDNKVVLDLLGENASQQLTYRGAAIGGGAMEWATVNW